MITKMLCQLSFQRDAHKYVILTEFTIFCTNIIHWCVETRKQDDFIKGILEFNVDVNGTDMHGKTPLHYAAMENTVEDDWSHSQEKITEEAMKEYVRIARLLLAKGANKEVKTEKDETPLHIICCKRKCTIYKITS